MLFNYLFTNCIVMTKNSEVQTNGNGVSKHFGEIKKVSKVPDFWRRLEFNEWTFSLLLFIFSLIIVVGKLAVNFEYITHWPLIDRRTLNSYQLPELNKERLETFTESISRLLEKHGWIIRAAFGGLATMSFTWFIIYKDSNVPGINPPSPFRNTKQRFTKDEIGIPTNYLVGVLNGLLIFFYMCL